MQGTVGHRSGMGPAALGLILVVIGAGALIVRQLGFDLFEAVGSQGWPFLIIVPGLVLLGAALLPAPPKGLGFAIAGSIVTAIGGLLLYQARSEHWESWAYAWALIPMAGGIGTLLYGLLTRASSLVASGLWMASISAIMLVAGAWFFEGIFAGELRFAEIGEWWPVAVIAVGVVIVLASFLRRPRTMSPAPPTTTDSLTDEGPHPL